MLSTKMALAAVAAAVAFCAAATSAMAEEKPMSWFVNGTKLTKGTTVALASTAKVDAATIISAPSLSLKISCSGYSLSGAELIGGEEKGKLESAKYENCSEVTPSNCKLSSTTIATTPLTLILSLFSAPEQAGPHLLKLATAQKGSTIAELEFTGSCTLVGEQHLSGMFKEALEGWGSEESTHVAEGLYTTENNSLELDGAKVYISAGRTLLKLSSGAKWSFHE
jgi:hypothetical protein